MNDVKVDSSDLRHPLGALKYIEYIQDRSKDIFMDLNGIPEMTAFIAITKDLNSGLPLPHVSLAVITLEPIGEIDADSGRDKQMFAEAIKGLAHKGEAVLICILSEAWLVHATTEEEIEFAKEWVRTHNGISGCPLRKDMVLIQVEHKGMSPRNQLWAAPITNLDGKRSVGDFSNQPALDDGRFFNLLP